MPYTPPAQRSPVASVATTPLRKLEQPVQQATKPQQNGITSHAGSRPSLPRSHSSQSYLHKHRRSPSLSKQTAELAEIAALESGLTNQQINGKVYDSSIALDRLNGILVHHNQRGTESPPSSHSSGDEAPSARGRHRKMANLEELQAAIRGIEQNRQGSPAPPEERKENKLARDFSIPHLDGSAEITAADDRTDVRPPLSDGARKISHSRSCTDTNAYFDVPKTTFDTAPKAGSDEDLDDEDLAIKPSLIRKKSGELVRPALRGKRRPSSMPGTPTYSKAVHFQDNSLEHVRTFLQVDRPIAVSAGSSPVDVHTDDEEFPFSDSDAGRQTPYEWEMKLTNFPRDTYQRQALPARAEKIYLSADTKTLFGDIAVRNLAFHKVVIARFTLDYWKTTSEVVAEFNRDVRRPSLGDSCDRFTFEIKLEEHANLENKTLFFCVKYQVSGKEFWDNNNSMNYQVDFAKKFKPMNGKPAAQTSSAHTVGLPRSRSPHKRPRSMPSFDDFGNHSAPFNFTSFPPSTSVTGDTPIRFRQKPSTIAPVSDAPLTKSISTNQQAFSNRYDFGASLSAAIQNSTNKVPSPRHEVPALKLPHPPKIVKSETKLDGVADTTLSRPATLASDKPAMQSTSYTELLDKYCFVRSRPTDAKKDGAGLVS